MKSHYVLKRVMFFLFLIIIPLFSISCTIQKQNNQALIKDFKNVILIGWDGVQREHLYELINQEKLPNLERLYNEGAIVNITITTGETETKPGWAEILTGYNSEILGIYSNEDYKPIPKGYTIFERLENHFGKDNIAAIFMGGKSNNLGARGPHKICINCIHRYKDSKMKTKWWEENTSAPTITPGEERIFEEREGEPYYYTKDILELYLTGLGNSSNVGAEAIRTLEKYKDKRFFAFFHFEEPDELGHIYGENSKEYSQGIITDDLWLGKIVEKLKELGIYDETLIYVTSDHGFDEDQDRHSNAPYVFLATNDPKIKTNGDRKDITPTILSKYGFGLEKIEPKLDGKSEFT